ncbi:hypothetical protein TSUD_173860 [Trifolium subterraneum]|nr:hypothetical protein TSUD_173860 [Trifolium subterraneum]
MKILDANVSALTNFEVLDFLRSKGASKDPSRVIAKVAMSEYKVYDYLVNTSANVQTRESIAEYLSVIKQHDLTEAEILNIINIGPAAAVEIYPIIEECPDRFADEKVTEIVELVQKTLPKLTINETAEETTEGDEETDPQAHGNGEDSQDKTEGGEQMDTS